MANESDVQEFSIAELSDEDQGRVIVLSHALKGALLKGLLHRMNPERYPLAGGVQEIETQGGVAAQLVDAAIFELMRARLEAVAQDSLIIKAATGMELDQFRKPGSIRITPIGPKQPAALIAPKKSKYKRLDLNLRALHAVDETGSGTGEWGTDDMLLGAIRVGASGNVAYTNAIIAGEFDDGTRREYGELPFGTVSMQTTPGFPKTFYWIFLLVESDSDDAEVASGITSALSSLVKAVGTATGYGAVGVIAGAIIDAVGWIIGLFISEAVFPPYGVAIQLVSDSDFGADGVVDHHTGNISAFAGTYRIGYRLRLVV